MVSLAGAEVLMKSENFIFAMAEAFDMLSRGIVFFR